MSRTASIGDIGNIFDGLTCPTRGCNYIYIIMYSDNWQHTSTICTVFLVSNAPVNLVVCVKAYGHMATDRD